MNVKRQRNLNSLVGVLFTSAALCSPVKGSELSVQTNAKREGNYGLEIIASSQCSSDRNAEVPNQGISTTETYEGCQTLTAANVDIISGGDVTFMAGEKITLQPGFSVVGGDFSAKIDTNLSSAAYVQDNSPKDEHLYRARFYVNPSNLSLNEDETLNIFTAYRNNENEEFHLTFVGGISTISLEATARSEGTTTTAVMENAIPTTYFALEFEWLAADNGSNGHLDVWVEDVLVGSLPGLNNGNGVVNKIRWGLVDGIEGNTAGSIFLDAFVSTRSATQIGIILP